MIRNLRRKFIVISMCSTFFVLAVILGALNIVTYRKSVERADELLDILKNNRENISSEPGEEKEWEFPQDRTGQRHDFSPETKYETRYFTVRTDEEGNPDKVNVERISSVTSDRAEQYALQVIERGEERGFLEGYRYLKVDQEEGSLLIFLDISRDRNNFYMVLGSSAGVGLLGLFMVFVLVVFFSRLVFRPVAESVEKQKRFITDASHELKTPLTVIHANMEVLEMEQGKSPWIDSTKKQTEKLSHLTSRLVTLARIDEKGTPDMVVDFSMSDAVEETAASFQAPALARGKKLLVTVEKDVTCCGDEKEIRQLLSILLDNGIKYAKEGAAIEVTLKKKGKTVVLRVENPVEGISEGNQNILFERFYRKDSSRNSQTGGSGIGLSVAKAITEAHKGKIWAYCNGETLSIVVEIPRFYRKNRRM